MLNSQDVEVVVPLTVLGEVSNLADPENPVVRAIHDAGWGVDTSSPSPSILASVSRFRLDPGEESVVTLALENPGCEVVLDDRAGRRCAEAHGVRLLGTLGVVILAKRIGRIAAARPIIEELRRAVFTSQTT